MKTAARAPRAARWLLERALPPDVRDGVTGDLDEVFARQYQKAGRLRAGLWYWGETASFSTRFLAERMRGRARGMTLGMCMSWLDIRLAVRMLSRYPGLTLVGGLAMSVAIALGAAFFEFAHDHLDTTLPFRDGDRIVGIQNWNRETGRPEPRSLHEFAAWREQLRSVRELGAFSLVERNLIVDGGRTEPVTVAEISASAFRVTGVSALLGRTEQIADRVVLAVLMGIALLTLVLSTVGIYSLMAFTVSQRTREIGIRVALGADPRQIVSTIFSRATVQLGLGVLAGGAGAVLLAIADGEQMQIALLVVVAALMLFVGLLACAVPVRRVLRIHPTEALRQA